MAWTDPIDAYCERTSAAFWAEPVNAATNAAFILAALAGFAIWRKRDVLARIGGEPRDYAGLALCALVFVIGVGSFLFHTFADRWSVLADTIPIAVFIYGYFALALRRLLGLSLAASLLGTLAFLATSFAAEPLFAKLVGSSAGYVPALLALFGIGSWLRIAKRPGSEWVLGAGCVFSISLAFRMADMPVCDAFPLGTHFGWHILNAVTLFLLLRAALPQAASERIS
ncbi:hypothetical protein [Aureimonas psammosilenae]|uniref:hypothetical protein n=1 Tax=Aureimonas psammosilenae TaxID=2495496 RepID=UPI00126099D1|nr:hypothetical protein [Aureimonas psammosilenae]